MVQTTRLIIDSTTRDVTNYPIANDFVVRLCPPLRKVRRITLTQMRVPIVDDDYTYVVPVIANISRNMYALSDENGPWPTGSLGMVMLKTVDTTADNPYSIYDRKFETDRSIEIPEGVNLGHLEIQLWCRGDISVWGYVAPILYPLTTENGVETPGTNRNVWMELEIESDE